MVAMTMVVLSVGMRGAQNAGGENGFIGAVRGEEGGYQCIGTLISPRWFLTSAQCVASLVGTRKKLVFGRDILLPLFEVDLPVEIRTHSSLDAALVAIQTPLPAALLASGEISILAVADPSVASDSRLISSSMAVAVSWGNERPMGPTPRLLRQATILLQSPPACRARVASLGIDFQPEWICFSEASSVRFCEYEEGAPLFVQDPTGRNVLIAIYSRYLGSAPLSCSFDTEQLVVFSSMRLLYDWINSIAQIKQSGLLPGSNGSAPVFGGDAAGLQAASGSILFTPAPVDSVIDIDSSDDSDDESSTVGQVILSGVYQVFSGCVESICCCPSSRLEISQQGKEFSVSSVWSCGSQLAGIVRGTIEETFIQLTLRGQNYTVSQSGPFIQVVNPQRLACSFSALR